MDEFDLFRSDTDADGAALLTQRSLVDTRERLGAMLEVMPIGLLIHTEHSILFSNKAACGLLRRDASRLVGQHLFDYLRDADIDLASAVFRELLNGSRESAELEAVLNLGPRQLRLVRMIASRLPWPGSPVVQVLITDITEQKRAENSLRKLTITDELTGAYNRRHLTYEAALYLSSGGGQVPVSVAIVDIDHFKSVNDTYGHAVGDLALKRLTSLANDVLATIEGTDSPLFARHGGEEFVLLLPGLDGEAATATAERLRDAVEAMRIDLKDGVLRFTVSVGVATYRSSDGDFDGLLNRADQALYRAKRDGRNRVIVADDDSVSSSEASSPLQRERRRVATG